MVIRRAVGAAGVALAMGCAPAATTPAPAGGVTPDAARATPEAILSSLSLRDKAAQMVWPWVLGDYVAAGSPAWERTAALVTREHVGGLIISVGSPIEIAAKLNALQELSALPLLVGADFEGGAGFRARGGYFTPNAIDLGGATLFPQQMAIGAARDTALAYALGRITAREGRALGVHVAFAPVLDVNNNPANPVIGTRSFGEDPALVAQLGAAAVRGIQDHGMLATGKHFPGHGDTEVNSHLGLPVIPVTQARLDSVELVPFVAAVRAGLGAMMTAHLALPNVVHDSTPATLSPDIMRGLLRERLGFEGILSTDAMDMRGVLARMGLAEATKQAVIAGNDIILMPQDVPGAIDAIVAGVQEGRFTEARVDSSVRRLLALKERMGLHRERTVRLDSLRAIVGAPEHVQMAQLAAERGITLVRDSQAVVPLRADSGTRVLSLTVAGRNNLGAGREFDAELRRAIPRTRSQFVAWGDPALDVSRLLGAADSADVVVVGVHQLAGYDLLETTGAPSALVELARGLSARRARLVVVAFDSPYLLMQIPDVPAYMIAWGGFPASQRAAARALVGAAPITGKLPITIPPLAAFGDGIQRAAPPR
jgi:beta-N-acetylhexosaminidase